MDRRELQEKVHEHCGMDFARVPGQSLQKIERQYIDAQWVSGGLTGGNCWGDDANQPIAADPEPEFEGLDELLEDICPTLSFLHYKKLMKEVEYDEETQGEYYGNYTKHAIKRLSVDTLYDYLTEWGYI